MFKVYGPQNAHDQFEKEWVESDIKNKYDNLLYFKSNIIEVMNKYIKKNDKIIEAGCGLGQFVLHYKDRGYDILGVDYSAKAIKKLKNYDKDLKVEYGDCTKLKYPDNSFDFYMSFGVIEHLEEGPEAYLKEAKRILKSGGYGFISVPNENNIAYYKVYDKNLRKTEANEFFEYGYKKEEFINILKENGFKVVALVFHDYYVSLCRYKIFTFGVKEPFKLNFLGKMLEKILIKLNNESFSWMIGAVVQNEK